MQPLRRPHAEPSSAGVPGCLILVFGEAALAADLITAWKTIWEAALAVNLITASAAAGAAATRNMVIQNAARYSPTASESETQQTSKYVGRRKPRVTSNVVEIVSKVSKVDTCLGRLDRLVVFDKAGQHVGSDRSDRFDSQ